VKYKSLLEVLRLSMLSFNRRDLGPAGAELCYLSPVKSGRSGLRPQSRI
jgi:hypothetical protein